jgi:thiamine kinase-like enzyme
MASQRETDDFFSNLQTVVSESGAEREAAEYIRNLTCWSAPIELKVLPGGLSNVNFVVATAGSRYVVRYGRDLPDYGSYRWKEAAALRAASAVGVAPRVVFTAESAIVMEFLEGRALTPPDVRNRHTLDRIVPALRTLHRQAANELDSVDIMFWPFHHCRWYLRQALARSDLLDPRWRPIAQRMQSQVEPLERAVGAVSMVFGHGDLAPQNMMFHHDCVKFVDMEYSGFAPDLFDLAGLALNCEFDDATSNYLLESYYGAPVTPQLLRRFQAMVLIAGMRESAWSFKSETARRAIAFDFCEYSKYCVDRQERLESRFDQIDLS